MYISTYVQEGSLMHRSITGCKGRGGCGFKFMGYILIISLLSLRRKLMISSRMKQEFG